MQDVLQPKNAISLVRGSDRTFDLVVTKGDGTPQNLTGARLVLSVKEKDTDPSPRIFKSTDDVNQIRITDPTGGKVEIYFVAADTKRFVPKQYLYDVWMQLGGGTFVIVEQTILDLTPGITTL